MSDAQIAQAFAEGRIPSDSTYITPQYLKQSRDEPAIVAILFICVLVNVILALRYYSRIFIVKSFGVDDVLAFVGDLCYITFTALSVVLIKEGSGRHIELIEYVLTDSEVAATEVNDYVAHIIYTTALFVCRLSGLWFFHRLCRKHTALSRVINAAAVFLLIAYLPQVCLIIFHCRPVTGLWPYAWQAEANDFTCLNWGTVYCTNSGLSLVCDFVVFSIPVAMIKSLQLSRSRKIALAFILLPGVAVIAISCVRVWLVAVGQWASDGSWFYDPQLAIEGAEIGGTLIALSVPALKPLFSECFGFVKDSLNDSEKNSGLKLSTWSSRRPSGHDELIVSPPSKTRKEEWEDNRPGSSLQTSVRAGSGKRGMSLENTATSDDSLYPDQIPHHDSHKDSHKDTHKESHQDSDRQEDHERLGGIGDITVKKDVDLYVHSPDSRP